MLWNQSTHFNMAVRWAHPFARKVFEIKLWRKRGSCKTTKTGIWTNCYHRFKTFKFNVSLKTCIWPFLCMKPNHKNNRSHLNRHVLHASYVVCASYVFCDLFRFRLVTFCNDESHIRSHSDCQHRLLIVPLTYWDRDKTAAIFADHTFKLYFFYEKLGTLIKVSVKFVLQTPITINRASVWIMACHQIGDKSYLNQWWLILLTYICVTPACTRRVSTCITIWQTCMLKGYNTTTIIIYTIKQQQPCGVMQSPLRLGILEFSSCRLCTMRNPTPERDNESIYHDIIW